MEENNDLSTIWPVLQQIAMNSNTVNTPNCPVKIEPTELTHSPTNSSPTPCQSPSSSGSPSAPKRAGDDLDDELDSKKSKKEEWDVVPHHRGELPKVPDVVTPETNFMLVPGRLTLLTGTTKHWVTVGEIARRLGSPENLNTSVLAAILRRSKSKNVGKDLRECLEKFGMRVPLGKRKTTQISLFTSMLEGECEQLAKDFDSICNSEFPVRQLAQKIVSQNGKQEVENVRKRGEELQIASKLMNELVAAMTSSSGTSVEQPMENFQLCTHNFGTPALLSAFGTFNRLVNAQLEELTPKPQPLRPAQPFQVRVDQNQEQFLALQALLQMCQQRNGI